MIHHHLDKYINCYKNLPRLIIKEDYKDIILTKNEDFLINTFHVLHQVVAFRIQLAISKEKEESIEFSIPPVEFIGNYFINEEKFNQFLNSNYIKSFAVLVWTKYQLIQEVWNIFSSKDFCLPLKLPKNIESIGHWWWLLQCEDTREAMKSVGLLGENPKVVGKREYTDFNTLFINLIDSESHNFDINLILDKSVKDDIRDISASEALEIICFNLLDRQHNVRTSNFEDYYKKWIAATRSFNSAILKASEVRGAYLACDEIIVLKKYKKIPKKLMQYKKSLVVPEVFRYLVN